MALTREQLLIDVAASSKNAEKEIQKAIDKVSDLEKSTKQTSKSSSMALREVEKQYQNLAEQINQSSIVSKSMSVEIENAETIDRVTSRVNEMVEALSSAPSTFLAMVGATKKATSELTDLEKLVQKHSDSTDELDKKTNKFVNDIKNLNKVIQKTSWREAIESNTQIALSLDEVSDAYGKNINDLIKDVDRFARRLEQVEKGNQAAEGFVDDDDYIAFKTLDRLLSNTGEGFEEFGETGESAVSKIIKAMGGLAVATVLSEKAHKAFERGFNFGFAKTELEKIAFAARKTIPEIADNFNVFQDEILMVGSKMIKLKDLLNEDFWIAYVKAGDRAFDSVLGNIKTFDSAVRSELNIGLRQYSKEIKDTAEQLNARSGFRRFFDGISEGFKQIARESGKFNFVASIIRGNFEEAFREIIILINNLNVQFSRFFRSTIGSFGRFGTVGAQRVSILSRVMLEAQFSIENMAKAAKAAGKQINSSFILKNIRNQINSLILTINIFSTMAAQKISDVIKSISLSFTKSSNFFTAFALNFTLIGEAAVKAIPKLIRFSVEGVVAVANSIKNFGSNELIGVIKSIVGSIATLRKSFLGLLEASVLVAPGLAIFGGVLKQSDNAVISLIGSLVELAGVLLGGVGSAFTWIVTKISDFVSAIAIEVNKALQEFVKMAIKAEQSARRFGFVIANFDRFTSGATGGLESWNKIVEEMADKTLFTEESIRKAVSSLVKESQILGLSFETMASLLGASADIAESSSADISDSARAIISALTGSSQSLLGMGVDLRSSALDHSKYAKSVGKTTDSMNEQEKVLAGLSSLFEQHKFIVGAAEEATNTAAGAQALFEKNLDRVKIRLGEQSVIVNATTQAYNEFLIGFLKLPKPVIEVTGFILDFGSSLLATLGFLIRYLTIIPALVLGYNALNAVIVNSVKIQGALSAAIAVVNTNIGAQIIAVTSLSALFRNLLVIIKAIMVGGFIKLLGIIKVVALSLLTLKTVLLGLAAIFGFEAFGSISDTFKEMAQTLNIFKSESEDSSKKTMKMAISIDFLDNAVKKIINTFKFFRKSLQDTFRIIALGLLGIVVSAQGALTALINLFKTGFKSAGRNTAGMKKISQDFFAIRKEINKTIDSFGVLKTSMQGVKFGAEKMGASINDSRLSLSRLREEAFKGLDDTLVSDLRIEAFGNDVEKASNAFLIANENFNRAFTALNSSLGENEELQKKFNDAAIERERARLGLLALKEQKINDLNKLINDGDIEQLQQAREKVKLITIENQKRLELFETTRSALAASSALNSQEIKDLEKIRSKLIEQNKIRLENAKNEMGALRNKELLDQINKINERQQDQVNALAEIGTTEIELIRLGVEREQAEIDIAAAKVKSLNLSEEETKILLENLNIARKTSIELGKRKEQEAADKAGGADSAFKGMSTAMENAGSIIGGNIGTALSDGASALSGVMGGAVMGMMGAAQMFVDAAQALVDFIPGLLNSIADLFNSLTALPLTIMNALDRVWDSLINFLANFVPNLVKAIEGILVGFVDFLVQFPDTIMTMISETLPSVIQSLIDRLPEIAEKFMIAMVASLPKLIVGAIKLFELMMVRLPVAIIKAIPAIVDGIVNGIIEGIRQGANAIMSLFGKGFETGLINFEEQIKKVARVATGAASEIFNVQDLSVKTGGDQSFVEEAEQAARKARNILQMWWDKTFGSLSMHGLMVTLQHFWDNTFGKLSMSGLETTLRKFWDQTFGNASMNGLTTTLEDIWKKTFGKLSVEGVKQTWQPIQELWDKSFGKLNSEKLTENFGAPIQKAWDDSFGKLNTKKLSENFGAPIQKAWDESFGKISMAGLKATFQPIQDAWNNSFGKLSVEGMQTTFKDFGGKIWKGFEDAVNGVGEFFKNIGGMIWEGLKSGVNGIGGVIQGALDTLNPANLFNKLFTVPQHAYGQGTVEKVLGVDIPFVSFNKGGNVVPGDAVFNGDHPGNDVVPAMLSPGEVVLPRSVVNAPGADKVIDALLRKEKLPGFYTVSVSTKGVRVSGAPSINLPDAPKVSVKDLKNISVNDLQKVSINDIVDAADNIVQGGGNALRDIGNSASALAQQLVGGLGLDKMWAGVMDRLRDSIMTMISKAPGFENAQTPGDVKQKFEFGNNLKSTFQELEKLVDQGVITKQQSIDHAANVAAASSAGFIGFQEGGVVPGTGRGDIVPSLLEPGEIVLSRQQVQGIKGMMGGGATVNQEYTIEVTINSSEKIDEDFIRDRLFPEIRDELRRESLDGRRILAEAGVR